MRVFLIRLCAAVGALTSVVAFAQAPVPSSAPAPVTPARLEYRSAFEGYRAYQEPEARSWRESNEEAGSLGGHVGQIKSRSASPSSLTSKPETAGAPPIAAPGAVQRSKPATSPPASGSRPSSASPAAKPASAAHEGHAK